MNTQPLNRNNVLISKIGWKDEEKLKTMYTASVLTISDSCFNKQRDDLSGKLICEKILSLPTQVVSYEIIPDETDVIKKKLIEYCDLLKVNLILTTGGTGLGPRDNTPEATRQVLDKEVPGISEIMRLKGADLTQRAILSRSISGLRNNTLIVNLPGSVKGAQESLEMIFGVLIHAFEMIEGKDHH